MFKSYYGSYRSRTFADIFENVEAFKEGFNESQIPKEISEESINVLFYLLYAKYGNSHIAYDDENQFKYGIYSTIFMYGPSWEKRLSIQKSLRDLTEEELMRGGKAIYNHAYNPSTAPNTGSLDELTAINEQNVSNYKKSKLEGYASLLALIETDVTEPFLAKFKKYFLTVVAPDYPLLYENTVTD